MIQPNEAAGLTAALAKSIDQRATDLHNLLDDATYRRTIANRDESLMYAHSALDHLRTASRELRNIVLALGPAETQPTVRETAGSIDGKADIFHQPYCGHCGAAVTDPATHICEASA